MQTITTQERQTLFDIALQYCGTREAVFEISALNNLPITEELPAGSSITVPDMLDEKVVNFYQINEIIPTTVEIEENRINENSIITNDNSHYMITNNDENIKIVTNG